MTVEDPMKYLQWRVLNLLHSLTAFSVTPTFVIADPKAQRGVLSMCRDIFELMYF